MRGGLAWSRSGSIQIGPLWQNGVVYIYLCVYMTGIKILYTLHVCGVAHT